MISTLIAGLSVLSFLGIANIYINCLLLAEMPNDSSKKY
ncbi:hypothetical protein NIES4074_36760 [Cylindrospermum sp. NIES-4074]|nr:hypothetical protein NIES4074_36760 [Cylindrospermum sp. NIES-4074]